MTNKPSLAGKHYWLVGASAGIGKALAHELADAGVDLTLSARSGTALNELNRELRGTAQVVPLDVTNSDSIDQAMLSVQDIDGLVYLAGDYTPMAALNWNETDAIKMADVNFLGAMRILPRVLRSTKLKEDGHLVIVGSLAGFSGLPGAIGYGASKAALMHLAENIKSDFKGTEMRVQVVNPGFVKTRLTDKNEFKMPFIQTPEKAAKQIVTHMNTKRFSKSFPGAFSWFFKLRAVWKLLLS